MLSVSPASAALDVPVTTLIVVTFTERLDSTSVHGGSIPITIDGFSGQVAGSYTVNGAVVTFIPTTPLPPAIRVRVRVNSGQVRDLAGNTSGFFFSHFGTAGAGVDTTPPTVVMVTPTDGATQIAPEQTAVVLTFSASLNAGTITSSTFALFADGNLLNTWRTRSADNRTVTITGRSDRVPAASVITVVVTSGVEDLSGNALANFSSQFTTASVDTTEPQVVTQRPGNGATGVALGTSVVLYVNEPLDVATIPGALLVSQNGLLVTGTTSVTGQGRTIEFVPDVPWVHEALVEVFLTTAARDVAGNALRNHQASFRTVVDTNTLAPAVVRTYPVSFGTNVPRNGVIEMEFTEPLDPTTVNETTVLLNENLFQAPQIPRTVTLERGGRVIRIVPTVLLTGDLFHLATITNDIRDLNGVGPVFTTFRRFFTPGTQEDTTPPTVVAVTPPDGAVDVGVNANVRVRFDEPINPLTVTGSTILVTDTSQAIVPCTITFNTTNTDVTIVPHTPLPDSMTVTVTVQGVEDTAGQVVVPQTTSFTTRTGPDTTAPLVLQTTPFAGATEVPVNAVITLEVDEPIDATTVDAASFLVRDNTTRLVVPGSFSVSADGRAVTFVPDVPFAVGRSHSVFFRNRGMLDLAGNQLTGPYFSSDFSFTVAFETDTTGPQVTQVLPVDGSTSVPTNTPVVITFDEPVQAFGLEQVIVIAGGNTVTVTRSLSDGNRTLTLTPVALLAPLTLHTVEIAGVQDLAGNALLTVVTSSFTTGAGADL